MPKALPRLGVNIDHIATREDRRHIRDDDMARLQALCSNENIPLNMEMAATEEMRDIALRLNPKAVCIVPERREERTTEGGLDVAGLHNRLVPADILASLKRGSKLAHSLGLEVHFGHGLTYDNVKPIAAIPEGMELNIGHFLIGEAIFVGLEAAISQMRMIVMEARAV